MDTTDLIAQMNLPIPDQLIMFPVAVLEPGESDHQQKMTILAGDIEVEPDDAPPERTAFTLAVICAAPLLLELHIDHHKYLFDITDLIAAAQNVTRAPLG